MRSLSGAAANVIQIVKNNPLSTAYRQTEVYNFKLLVGYYVIPGEINYCATRGNLFMRMFARFCKGRFTWGRNPFYSVTKHK